MGRTLVGALAIATITASGQAGFGASPGEKRQGGRKARNVIFFVGDGMGVSTVTAARVFSVGVGGQLVVDQFAHMALPRTYSGVAITPDSAPTMSAMMTDVNTQPEGHRLRSRLQLPPSRFPSYRGGRSC